MINFLNLNKKAQTSFEYLFLLGGLIFLAVLVLSVFQFHVLPSVNSQIQANSANLQKLDCLKTWENSPNSVYANYQLDEQTGPNLSDTSGNSLSLSIYNPPWQQSNCQKNGCISLTNPEFINITNSSSLDGPNNYTVEFWIQDSGTSQTIYSTSNTVNNGFSIIDSSSGYIAVNCSGNIYSNTSNTLVDDNSWHFVQASITPTSVYIYQDGVSIYNNSAASCTLSSTARFNTIGASCSTYSSSSCYNYMIGNLDELSILNVAESSTQILSDYQFYNVGSTPLWSFNPIYLSAQYHFDDGSGINVTDSSSNANNGVLQNVFNDRLASGCEFSNCLTLDGSSIYAYLAPNSVTAPTSITVEGWVNRSISTRPFNYIISQEDPSGTSGWAVGLLGTSTVCPNSVPGMLFLYNGSNYVCSTGAVPFGWNFFAITNNATNTSIYLNGALNNWGSQVFSYSSAANLSIGAYTSSGSVSNYFNGTLNDIVVYSSALNSEQLNSDFTCSD